jgi:hypothetical protein
MKSDDIGWTAKVPTRSIPKVSRARGVHAGMYRSNLEGLAERIRLLEEENLRLDGDLAHARRIRWPRQVLRASAATLAALVIAAFGAALGYRYAVDKLLEASEADARACRARLWECSIPAEDP